VAKRPESSSTEARWPAAIAIIGLGGSSLALPDDMVPGPRWLVPIVIVLLLIPSILAHRRGRHDVDRALGYGLSVIVTVALAASLVSLLRLVGSRTAPELLKSASILWVTNILVFALWYFEIDGGGPHTRFHSKHKARDFLFPQQVAGNKAGWAPAFTDYLFVAFTASTALSPTDTYPLTHKAKLLMMVQALLSGVIILILVGRAVNILGR
jgi:hypothetical protein